MGQVNAFGMWEPGLEHPASADVGTVTEDAGTGAMQIIESHGQPSSPPDDPTIPWQANDLDSGGQWIWDTEQQAWR